MTGPLVSVLTPSLNQCSYVEQSLDSVLRQNYADVEQIVVDGGSTDGTLELLHEREGPGLRVHLLPGSTQAQALNAALAAAHGELVGWLNTDDMYFATDAISTAVRAFASNPESVAVYGDAVIADEHGLILRHSSVSARRLRRLQGVSALVQPAVFFRRDAVRDRFLREDLETQLDFEFWLYLRRVGPFAKVNRVLAVDRDYPGRKTQIFREAGKAETRALQREYGLRPALPTALASPLRWINRLRGIPALLSLERYELAWNAVIDSRGQRLVRQLTRSQRSLSVSR